MVKGISRQVILVNDAQTELFEQAIFILKDTRKNKQGITEDALLKEAQWLLHKPRSKRHLWGYGLFWSAVGAAATGLAWLLSVLI